MLDNCEAESRNNVMFDGSRLHIMYECGGFKSQVDRDGIENSRTHCEGIIDWVFALQQSEGREKTPFKQEQWERGEIELVEISKYGCVIVRRVMPDKEESKELRYHWMEEYTEGHLTY